MAGVTGLTFVKSFLLAVTLDSTLSVTCGGHEDAKIHEGGKELEGGKVDGSAKVETGSRAERGFLGAGLQHDAM